MVARVHEKRQNMGLLRLIKVMALIVGSPIAVVVSRGVGTSLLMTHWSLTK